VAGLVALLSKDFLRLVIIAVIIASPLAWWAMHKWLENFAYRTSISLWIFLLTGLVMLLLAFITLGFQTAKAAMANPVNSLRSE
jgi:putative ABC transport system permease protein